MTIGTSQHCSSLVEKGGIEIFLRAFKNADQNNEKPILEMVIFKLYRFDFLFLFKFFFIFFILKMIFLQIMKDFLDPWQYIRRYNKKP